MSAKNSVAGGKLESLLSPVMLPVVCYFLFGEKNRLCFIFRRICREFVHGDTKVLGSSSHYDFDIDLKNSHL